jgi:hypothetical protein
VTVKKANDRATVVCGDFRVRPDWPHAAFAAGCCGKNLARWFLFSAVSKDLASLTMTPNFARPPNPRPIQPMRTSEALIALAVVLAIALLVGAGILIGRMQSRRKDGTRIRKGPVGPRSGSRGASPPQRNLRLVTRKRN